MKRLATLAVLLALAPLIQADIGCNGTPNVGDGPLPWDTNEHIPMPLVVGVCYSGTTDLDGLWDVYAAGPGVTALTASSPNGCVRLVFDPLADGVWSATVCGVPRTFTGLALNGKVSLYGPGRAYHLLPS